MKIGIVTFFRVTNYGAMLQAYALRCHLERLGHSVVFVRHPLLSVSRPSLLSCFITRSLLGLRNRLKKYVRYPMVHFADGFPQTALCSSTADLRSEAADCDVLLVGSDQMWNPAWFAKRYLDLVMLDFANERQFRVAYAVSFGTLDWGKDQNALRAGELISKFSAISVREEVGADLIRRLSGRQDARWVVDPTLLQSADFYQALAEKSSLNVRGDDPYIFSYLLDEWENDDAARVALCNLKNEIGINTVRTDRTPVKGIMSVLCRMLKIEAKISVEDWLSRISRASFVFTNSFHGTVFAILFRRPFVTLLLRGTLSGMNDRVISLLKLVGLESRAVYADDICSMHAAVRCSISWDDVHLRLDRKRKEAFEFLLEIGTKGK